MDTEGGRGGGSTEWYTLIISLKNFKKKNLWLQKLSFYLMKAGVERKPVNSG